MSMVRIIHRGVEKLATPGVARHLIQVGAARAVRDGERGRARNETSSQEGPEAAPERLDDVPEGYDTVQGLEELTGGPEAS